MITITLGGELAQRFIPQFEAEVGTVAEAISAIRANFPTFMTYLAQAAQAGINFVVRVGYQEVGEELLACPISKKVKSIAILPVPAGSGGGFGKIILGAALLGLGLAGVGFLGISASTLALTGGALLLGGISSLFGRVKDPNSDEKDGKKSQVFGSPTQTIQEGGRVPVVYGTHLTGLYIVSARIRSYKTA